MWQLLCRQPTHSISNTLYGHRSLPCVTTLQEKKHKWKTQMEQKRKIWKCIVFLSPLILNYAINSFPNNLCINICSNIVLVSILLSPLIPKYSSIYSLRKHLSFCGVHSKYKMAFLLTPHIVWHPNVSKRNACHLSHPVVYEKWAFALVIQKKGGICHPLLLFYLGASGSFILLLVNGFINRALVITKLQLCL